MAKPVPANSGLLHALTPIAPVWSRTWRGFPTALGPLIGRERELAALSALLLDRRQRLITVTGPGGVGKTRLALEAAESVDEAFPDGAAFVPLAAISDPRLVVPAIALAFDVQDTASRPLRDVLTAALRERSLLLVLDNVEHLIDETLTLDLAALLEGCSQLTILVTSRAPLQLQHEHRFVTPPLALPEGTQALTPTALAELGTIALFVARAQAVSSHFQLDAENAPAVAAICRRLDGLPLAIELAAAWLRVLSPAALLDRLKSRLPLLTGGWHDQPARLRTMRSAIEWSHQLLTADERRLFRRLGLFTGGFSLEAAERVAGDSPLQWRGAWGGEGPPLQWRLPSRPGGARRRDRAWGGDDSPSVLELLAGLVDKSLVQQVDPIGPTPRFAVLETVREYALERLAESGESSSVEAARAAYFVDLIERILPESLGPHERHWHKVYSAELGNLRAALSWSLDHAPVMTLRMAAPLWICWSHHNLGESRRWLNTALARATSAESRVRAGALTTEAALACLMGDFASGEQGAATAAALASQAGDWQWEARARWILARNRLSAGRTDEVLVQLNRSLLLFTQSEWPVDHAWKAYTRATRGGAHFMRGDVKSGRSDYEQAIAEVRDAGSADVAIVILNDFAGWLIMLGDTARARRLLEEALTLTIGATGYFLPLAAMSCLALLTAMEGEAELTARRLGAIGAIRMRSGLVYPVHFQDRIDRATALAKESLGEGAFVLAWEAGRADPDTIFAEALDQAEGKTEHGDGDDGAQVRLSRREREVLRLLTSGSSDREIATTLYISPRTASHHVSAVLHKLDAGTRAEAAVLAVRLGLA